MLRVESDLEKSKSLREEQIKASHQQIEELKNNHRKKVVGVFNRKQLYLASGAIKRFTTLRQFPQNRV